MQFLLALAHTCFLFPFLSVRTKAGVRATGVAPRGRTLKTARSPRQRLSGPAEPPSLGDSASFLPSCLENPADGRGAASGLLLFLLWSRASLKLVPLRLHGNRFPPASPVVDDIGRLGARRRFGRGVARRVLVGSALSPRVGHYFLNYLH